MTWVCLFRLQERLVLPSSWTSKVNIPQGQSCLARDLARLKGSEHELRSRLLRDGNATCYMLFVELKDL